MFFYCLTPSELGDISPERGVGRSPKSIFQNSFRRNDFSFVNGHRVFGVLATHICTYLAAECRNRSENLTNRKLSIFYIEIVYQVFFQLQPKNIFFRDQKYFSKKKSAKIFFGENPEKNEISIFGQNFRISDFFRDFHRKIFLADFFFEKYF